MGRPVLPGWCSKGNKKRCRFSGAAIESQTRSLLKLGETLDALLAGTGGKECERRDWPRREKPESTRAETRNKTEKRKPRIVSRPKRMKTGHRHSSFQHYVSGLTNLHSAAERGKKRSKMSSSATAKIRSGGGPAAGPRRVIRAPRRMAQIGRPGGGRTHNLRFTKTRMGWGKRTTDRTVEASSCVSVVVGKAEKNRKAQIFCWEEARSKALFVVKKNAWSRGAKTHRPRLAAF